VRRAHLLQKTDSIQYIHSYLHDTPDNFTVSYLKRFEDKEPGLAAQRQAEPEYHSNPLNTLIAR